MRWYVEITAIGEASPSNKLCLEAAHWQPALQKARQIRGEDDKLSGVSVEFLDNGCKAVDASLRLVYQVSQAPDDAPLVDRGKPKAAEPAATEERPSKRGKRRKKKRKVRTGSELAGAGRAKKTMVLGSRGSAEVNEQPLDRTLSFGSRGEANITQPPGVLAPPDPDVPPVPPGTRRTTDRPAPLVAAEAAKAEPEAAKAEEATAEPESAAKSEADAAKADAAKADAAEPDAAKAEPAKAEPAKADAAKAEPAKAEPAKAEPAKAEPAKAKAEPEAAEAAKAEPEAKAAIDVGQKLMSTQDTKPSSDMPLHHHERAYAVALPQPLAKLEQFVHALLAEVEQDLHALPAGKVVSVALFDHRFTAEPKRPPIVTARWADWRGQPEIVFFPYAEEPATGAADAATVVGGAVLQPSAVPPAASRAEVKLAGGKEAEALAQTKPAKTKVGQEPSKVETKDEAKEGAAKAKAEAAKAEAAKAEAAKAEAAKVEAAKAEAAKAEAARAEAAKAKDAPAETKREPSGPVTARPKIAPIGGDSAASKKAGATDPPKRGAASRTLVGGTAPKARASSRRSLGERGTKKEEPRSDNSAAPTNGAVADRASRPSAPGRRMRLGGAGRDRVPSVPPADPLEDALSREEKAERLAAARERATSLAPAPSVPGQRVSGEDLLTDLFEEISELHHLRGPLEGAAFVLELALQKLPSEVGLVSLFDLDKREYVVVRQTGGDKSALLLRVGERASLPRRAMRSNRSVVLSEVTDNALEGDPRWREVGVAPRSLICAPVTKGGRYLGLIELANPHDGRVFRESDGHALTYIGQQFGEFLANHGVLLDPDAVVASAESSSP